DSILHKNPVPAVRLNPDIPLGLEDIINKALEKDRNLRYQHTSEIRTDLRRLKRDNESAGSVVEMANKASSSWSLPHHLQIRPRWFGVSLVVISILAFVGFAIRPEMPRPVVLSSVQITNDGRTKLGGTPLVTDGYR